MIRIWLICIGCLFLGACSLPPKSEELTLKIGMLKGEVISLMQSVEADDFSDGMTVVEFKDGVATLPEEDPKEWMWSVPGYEVILGTYFKDGRLTKLEFWDRTKIKRTYYHNQRYSHIDRITFHTKESTYEISVIEVIPGPGETVDSK